MTAQIIILPVQSRAVVPAPQDLTQVPAPQDHLTLWLSKYEAAMAALAECRTVDEVKDYHKRIITWYDSHLKGDLKKKAEEQKAENPAQ